ncbi:MAG: TonB C-terminal domain-containing protein [Prosthecobacter sp.]
MTVLHAALAVGGWWLWRDHLSRTNGGRAATLVWMNPQDFNGAQQPPPTLPAPTTPIVAAKPRSQPVTPASVEEPAPKATLVAAPPEQHRMEPTPNDEKVPLFAPASPRPKPPANRSITLRRVREQPAIQANMVGRNAPPIASPTLLDIARLNRMRPPPAVAMGQKPIEIEDPEAEKAFDAVEHALNAAFLAAWIAPPISEVPQHQREARLNVSVAPDGAIIKAQMVRFSGSHHLDQSIVEAAAQVKKISATLPSNFDKESYDLELNFLLLP